MKVFFTISGQEVASVPLPKPMCEEVRKSKGLFPSICLAGSSEDRVQVSFNHNMFDFNLEDKINDYYKEIYDGIRKNEFKKKLTRQLTLEIV